MLKTILSDDETTEVTAVASTAVHNKNQFQAAPCLLIHSDLYNIYKWYIFILMITVRIVNHCTAQI